MVNFIGGVRRGGRQESGKVARLEGEGGDRRAEPQTGPSQTGERKAETGGEAGDRSPRRPNRLERSNSRAARSLGRQDQRVKVGDRRPEI